MRKRICSEKLKEHCGLFGIFGHRDASKITYLGLYALQHRGEESCGIVSGDGKRMYLWRDMGLVADVFNEHNLSALPGRLAIGHTRYSTTGSSVLKNAQPLLIDCLKNSIAIAHNGNLVNSVVLRQALEKTGSIFQTTCDSEIIVHLMARSREKTFVRRLISSLKKIKGAYSLLLATEDQIIGVRDPYGFRPLCLGKLDNAWCLASESCAFDLIGARLVRDIRPGEIVFINKAGVRSFEPKELKASHHAHCIFEHVYFARPDSIIFGETVHLVRKKLGQRLAQEHPVDADIVVPVPDSGTSSALGYSYASGIPLDWGVIRNHYVGRTFIQPTQQIRDLGVKIKFNILRDVVKDKRVVIVDDSIVRGTTSKKRIRNFRQAGAREIHLRISCPPHKFPCLYGIDFHRPDELIANRYSLEDIKKFLDVDSLGYLSLEGMLTCLKYPKSDYCTACWTGDYPIKPEKTQEKFSLEKYCGQGEI
ncbi:MAG: amidophosphoribosyltransferase [Candidatus Omnitrophica bacterium]|nr:amidophosphoribosyltransferase [Candidatus Omnitrophota bacterium]MCM8770328.1 amidophosphoribosyltransferase [Candidatus Omnitrophota bacterium]